MTFVGVTAMLLSLLAIAWFSPIKSNFRLGLFLVIVILHLAATFIYYIYVQSNDADTALYYYDVYGFYTRGFGLSTTFVIWLTQTLIRLIGGTYLDYFLLYQVLGIWGLALVFRTMEEIADTLGTSVPPLMLALMFLPGMYFWTAAIGKDAPLFLACAMVVWASFSISTRWMWFGVAIGIMVLIRAHVAFATVAALAIAMVTGRGVPNVARFALFAVAIVSGWWILGTLQSELNADLSSIGGIAGFVETQTSQATIGVDDSLRNAPFLIKLLSLIYRPFFVDTNNIFGLVASVQNVAMLAITFVIVRNFRLFRKIFSASLPIRFATIHFIGINMMLTLGYYNVGLGLRQREMATPALLALFGALYTAAWLQNSARTNSVVPMMPTAR